MADDPDRDILPVKEGSCVETLISLIDPRERHLVCKLDRYQLEDKYLRLLDEASNLKKLSNCQEDKIKRLGTKLIRLAGNPRSCGLSLDIAGDDKNKMSALELENTKLKEKITVMRNQLLSHTMSGRSSSRSRNLVRPTSSGLVTCRSDNNRSRVPSCQCIVDTEHDDSDVRNYLVKIEKLEAQKKDMADRITDLEKELATYSASSQREKVADNVEYIRVWRQMKQLNEKLITAQDKNAALTAEINDLKTTIEQTTRNNQEITAVLTSERTRIAEMDSQMLKAKNSHFALREKEERIRDLANEVKILQQHNNELIALSTKNGQVEVENIALKKKLSEQVHEQQTMRTAFNNNQANIVGLQATNEQLLAKLQDLQATIDTLTIQLTSLHKQNEKRDAAMVASLATPACKQEGDTSKQACSTSIEQCKKCCEMYDKIMRLETAVDNARRNWQPSVKSVQTITPFIGTKDQSVMAIVEVEEKANSPSPSKEWKANHETNSLSREKILKLLDQAQINTPLDASRIAQKEDYTDILDVAQTQRHSDGEISCQTFCDEPSPVQNSRKGRLTILENMASNQILLMLLDILQEYLSFNNVEEKASSKGQILTIADTLIDVNNNLATKSDNRDVSADAKPCNITNFVAPIDDRIHKSAWTRSNCNNVKNCLAHLESDCYPSCAPGESAAVSTRNVGLFTKDTQDKTICCPAMHGKLKKSSYRDSNNDGCAEKVKTSMPRCDLMCHLRKQKDSPTEQEKRTVCKSKCLGDSVQLSVGSAQSFPLLITDKQGLIEIHVSQLQLSTLAPKISREEDLCNLYIYISWDIWDEKTAHTMAMRCPNLNFNFSSVYRIADLFSFFKNVLLEYLIFRVNIVRRDDTKYTIARARVSIKDILDYPQNKLHYIVPVNSIVSCTYGDNFGQLSLWIRLSCNVEMVEVFKEQYGIASLREAPHVPSKVVDVLEDRKDTEVSPNDRLTDSNSLYETTNSYDENNCIISNNEEYFSPINDNNEVLEEEDERYAIRRPDPGLSKNNMKEILKDHMPVRSSNVIEFKTPNPNAGSLLKESSSAIRDMHEVLSDNNWERYKQRTLLIFAKFRIDEKKHSIERDTLCAMLAECKSPNIKFVAVSEPPSEETADKECEDIGFATFNIREYALGDGCKDISLRIRDDQRREIGVLKIVVLGFDAIKQCLADIEANDFNSA